MNPNLINTAAASMTTSFSYKDLLLRKLYNSVTCCVLSQLVILVLYVFLVNINILHPQEWCLSAFSTLTSFSTWLFIIPFVTIIFAQSIICAKDYLFKHTYCSTRFQKFLSVFSLHNLVLLMLHVIVGAILVWLFLSLGRGQYQNLMNKCQKNHYCLVEGTFFLIVGGFWTGGYFFVKVYMSEKHLMFPVVHQRKVLQLKSAVLPMMRDSLTLSLWPSGWFVGLYYVWGNQICGYFKSIFGLVDDADADAASRGSVIIIYGYLWMFSALYYFSMNLMRFFFNLFLTEPVEFSLTKPATTSADSLTLQDAVNLSILPIIQNLACLDLYRLAQWTKLRRQMFFTLSQPGGHPHNWNILLENVLKLFTEYIELLNKSAVTEIAAPIKAQTIGVAPPLRATSPFLQSPEPLTANKFADLRNMSMNHQDAVTSTGLMDIVDVSHNPLPGFLLLHETFATKLKQKLHGVWNLVKVVLGINFLFGELPQANIQKCLANGQLIIWTSQGIADLTCASLVEDRFGIVQKDLPIIITTLVQLKQSLDKLNKVPALTRKIAGCSDFHFKMKGAVTMAVKRSLFNICHTFGDYLNDFPLSKDIVQHLHSFVVCK